MEEAIAPQRQELKILENERDLQVMATRLKSYSDAYSDESSNESRTACSEVASCPSVFTKETEEEQTAHTQSYKPYITQRFSDFPHLSPQFSHGTPLSS